MGEGGFRSSLSGPGELARSPGWLSVALSCSRLSTSLACGATGPGLLAAGPDRAVAGKVGAVMHILELRGKDEDGEWDYDIHHSPECPVDRPSAGDWFVCVQYNCDVGDIFYAEGLYAFGEELPDKPGRYEIGAWFTEYATLNGTEYESGLTVLRSLADGAHTVGESAL